MPDPRLRRVFEPVGKIDKNLIDKSLRDIGCYGLPAQL